MKLEMIQVLCCQHYLEEPLLFKISKARPQTYCMHLLYCCVNTHIAVTSGSIVYFLLYQHSRPIFSGNLLSTSSKLIKTSYLSLLKNGSGELNIEPFVFSCNFRCTLERLEQKVYYVYATLPRPLLLYGSQRSEILNI